MYVPNTRKVVAVRDVIIKESEVGSIPNNTETPDLLDEGSQLLGIWHPDDGHQDDGNREEQGTSTAIKEDRYDAESVNTQETTLRRDASDVEEAALDEESTATRGSLRDSEPLEDSETEDFSQTVGFFEEALEQADRAQPRRGTRARNVPQFFLEKSGTILLWLRVTMWNPQNSLRSQASWQKGPVVPGNEWRDQGTPRQRDLGPSETTHRQGRHTAGKWVYKVKLGPSGQVDKYKARYVAKGFKQVEGLDYFETFAPICKTETFRILLQLSAKQGHVMHQFDVKTAFLHWPIEEEVYLEQPQEFVEEGSDREKLLCRPNKSIYGLKQAANNWYKVLANFLLRQGLTRSRNNHCLFARSEAEDHTFILVWVDDIIVASINMTVISDVKKALEATFHMEDRGRLHRFLGLRIRQEEEKVTVDRERYIELILERFQMDQCKPSRTPADLNLKLKTAQNGGEEVDQRIYRSLVGSLLYLAKQTRPDIMFTVNILFRHMNAPINHHWLCGKRLLQYLQGSKGLNLTYTKEASYDLMGKVMQTGLEMWTTENQQRDITSSSTDVAQHSAGVSRSRPQLLFLHQKQNIRAWQQQFSKHSTWNNF